MTNNDELALKTRKDFEAYYNETHALKATSQFKRFGYYVSPTMQKAWELWQAAQSSLLAERDADKKRIAELEALTTEQDKRLITYAAIATKNASEARTVSVKLPEPPGPMSVGARTVYCGIVADVVAAFQTGLGDAGIKLEVGE